MDTIDLKTFDPIFDKNALFSLDVNLKDNLNRHHIFNPDRLHTSDIPLAREIFASSNCMWSYHYFPLTKLAQENQNLANPTIEDFVVWKDMIENNCMDYLKEKLFKNSVWKKVPDLQMLALHALGTQSPQLSTRKKSAKSENNIFNFFQTTNRILGVERPSVSVWNIAEKILDSTTYPWILGPHHSFHLYMQKLNENEADSSFPALRHPLCFYTMVPYQDFQMYITVIFREIREAVCRLDCSSFLPSRRFIKAYFIDFDGADPSVASVNVVKYNKNSNSYKTIITFVFLIDQKPIAVNKNKRWDFEGSPFPSRRGFGSTLQRCKVEDFFPTAGDEECLFSLNHPANVACLRNPFTLAKKITEKYALGEFQFAGFRLPMCEGKWFVVNFSETPFHIWGQRKLDVVKEKFVHKSVEYFSRPPNWKSLQDTLGHYFCKQLVKQVFKYYVGRYYISRSFSNSIILMVYLQTMMRCAKIHPNTRLGSQCLDFLETQINRKLPALNS